MKGIQWCVLPCKPSRWHQPIIRESPVEALWPHGEHCCYWYLLAIVLVGMRECQKQIQEEILILSHSLRRWACLAGRECGTRLVWESENLQHNHLHITVGQEVPVQSCTRRQDFPLTIHIPKWDFPGLLIRLKTMPPARDQIFSTQAHGLFHVQATRTSCMFVSFSLAMCHSLYNWRGHTCISLLSLKCIELRLAFERTE